MHSQQIIKFSSFISYFQHSAIFHVISLIKTRFSIYNKDYSTRAIFMGWCPKLWVTIFISLNINTFHFTSFFFFRTHKEIILDLDSQQFMQLKSHGDEDFPLTSPRAHLLSSPSLTLTGHSLFFVTHSAFRSTFLTTLLSVLKIQAAHSSAMLVTAYQIGQDKTQCNAIWSHMNIWHAYHQAIWVHNLFWHHLLEAACSLLLEFSTCIHLLIQFQLSGHLHHDATWATAINTN